jgi:hypothetical protein
MIDDWQSKPHHRHQNYPERHYGIMKSRVNITMNCTGYAWLLCIQYVSFLYNHISHRSLDWRTPLQLLTSETSDISILLHFTFWEEVYFTNVNSGFPSDTTEDSGYFVGFGDDVGYCMTFKVLSKTTQLILYRSNVRSAVDGLNNSLRLSNDGETSTVEYLPTEENTSNETYINSTNDGSRPMATFNPDDLIGQCFLDVPHEDGLQYWVRIIKAIDDHCTYINNHPDKVKFLLESTDGDYEKLSHTMK